MTNIHFYPQVLPTAVTKSAPTPWESAEGERARQRGVRSKDQFAIFSIIEGEALKSPQGTYLSDAELARRAKMSEPHATAIVKDLMLRGVVRENSGLLGRRALVPVGN